MKRFRSILLTLIITLIMPLLLCSCVKPFHLEKHGFETYEHNGVTYSSVGLNSPYEIDAFGDVTPYKDEFSCVDCDYFYSFDEGPFLSNPLDRALYFFEYCETDYPAVKAYCMENCIYLGDEATEEYNGYLFYDFYGKRDKNEHYHGDNYPEAFKRVFFNDEKHVIGFLGILTADKRAEILKEDVADWEVFLNKYYSEWYSFA